MKVSTVLSVAFAISGLAEAKNTRGGRKLAQIDEETGLTKRQQRKKEIAEATEAVSEEMITLDEIDVTIVEEGAQEELFITLDEIGAAGDVEEEVSVTVDVPAPPASSEDHERKGPHEVDGPKPLEDEPESGGKKKGGKGKGKGKGKRTKDIVHGEGKPGNSLTGGKKKRKGAKK